MADPWPFQGSTCFQLVSQWGCKLEACATLFFRVLVSLSWKLSTICKKKADDENQHPSQKAVWHREDEPSFSRKKRNHEHARRRSAPDSNPTAGGGFSPEQIWLFGAHAWKGGKGKAEGVL